jgi:hypothetical protein
MVFASASSAIAIGDLQPLAVRRVPRLVSGPPEHENEAMNHV